MNLAYHIKNSELFHRALSFFIESGWTIVPQEDMSTTLHTIWRLKITGNFVLFHKFLPGNVPAHVFLFCKNSYSNIYIAFCANNTFKETKSYNDSRFGTLFSIEYRSFIIRYSVSS